MAEFIPRGTWVSALAIGFAAATFLCFYIPLVKGRARKQNT
jgi:hypothetical protein